ncbi:ubiquitin thioesterase zranb1-like [Mercenaria mercenaria]|uniref:ubiquitin thioesterase zranb1-like n=1 Tax=Mercenaria mercenaria TaxID=6596 RepID=UPI00234F5704|nr:ubiquitin thioesterase zranb1-like [Mercenaria mercenaria]
MSDEAKWDCSRCTYKNFPASRKCVLCQGPRPSNVISDLENSEQDIYKVAELEARNNEQTGSLVVKSPVPGSSEWTCRYCTYRNPNRSTKKCIQCLMTKDFKMTFTPESISEGTKCSDVEPLTVSPGESSSASSSKMLMLKQKTKFAFGRTVSAVIKWSCKACTYENFPKALSCTMCTTRRDWPADGNDSPSPKSQFDLNELQLEIDVDSKNQENMKSGQNSPNRTSGSQRNNKSGQNSPQTSNEPSNLNVSQGSPVSSNNRSGQNSPNTSGQTSPNNKSSPSSSHRNLSQEHIIPYNQDAEQNTSKQTSPKNNRSGQVSPQDPGQTSPNSVIRGSPGIARASKSNRNQNRVRNEALYIQDTVGAIGGMRDDDRRERRIQKLRKKLSREDTIWLNACESVIKGDSSGIEIYLTSGGDPARQLTKDEVLILDRPSAYEIGHTLVHLALRFRRDDMVAVLLAATDISSKGFKRLPSYTCPDLSSAIRREIFVMLKQHKRTFSCYFLTDHCTFTLPAGIWDFPPHVQTQLFDEILDTDVDKELTDECVINWSVELTENLRSRLYALWNRTAGDCLLDSVLQATWGILDIDNTLRRALSDSLLEARNSFYPKWKEYETVQAHLMNFSLDEDQWQRDWAVLLSLASQPGASLEQMHIFALAHILRRPIIVYGVKVVKSFRGESIDFARFEGVYLPLLWERSFCSKTPIALGYTRGHFSALVPMEIDSGIALAGAHIDNAVEEQVFYLPLVDHEGSFLPIHFVTGTELGQEETILRRWFDCLVTQEGLFVAIQKIEKRPALVGQMVEVWLDHYRHEANKRSQRGNTSQYSSEDESDQEE